MGAPSKGLKTLFPPWRKSIDHAWTIGNETMKNLNDDIDVIHQIVTLHAKTFDLSQTQNLQMQSEPKIRRTQALQPSTSYFHLLEIRWLEFDSQVDFVCKCKTNMSIIGIGFVDKNFHPFSSKALAVRVEVHRPDFRITALLVVNKCWNAIGCCGVGEWFE